MSSAIPGPIIQSRPITVGDARGYKGATPPDAFRIGVCVVISKAGLS